MLFGTRSKKLRREVEQAEALLKQREQENDRYSGREDDPQVPRQLRQSRHRHALPEHLPREINRLEPTETCCPECGGELDYLGEVSAEQLELNSPGFPGEYFICELRLPDHCFRWKHNKLFLLLPEEYGPAFPANDERHINEALPCADVSKISHPQLVRTFCPELTVYAVACGNGFPADCSADLFTPENTGKTHNRHKTCHSTSGHPDTFP